MKGEFCGRHASLSERRLAARGQRLSRARARARLRVGASRLCLDNNIIKSIANLSHLVNLTWRVEPARARALKFRLKCGFGRDSSGAL